MREVCAEFLGEVTEWPNVRDWKSRVGQKPTGGSNPPLSASKNLNRTFGLGSFSLFFSAFQHCI